MELSTTALVMLALVFLFLAGLCVSLYIAWRNEQQLLEQRDKDVEYYRDRLQSLARVHGITIDGDEEDDGIDGDDDSFYDEFDMFDEMEREEEDEVEHIKLPINMKGMLIEVEDGQIVSMKRLPSKPDQDETQTSIIRQTTEPSTPTNEGTQETL